MKKPSQPKRTAKCMACQRRVRVSSLEHRICSRCRKLPDPVRFSNFSVQFHPLMCLAEITTDDGWVINLGEGFMGCRRPDFPGAFMLPHSRKSEIEAIVAKYGSPVSGAWTEAMFLEAMGLMRDFSAVMRDQIEKTLGRNV